MKIIQLTKGGEALVDDLDYDDLTQWRWRRIRDGRNFYAARDVKIAPNKYRVLRMHTYLLPGNEAVDHIDHNGLNNQRVNLRPSTHAQNTRNKSKKLNSSSQYLGVSWYPHKGMNKWRVQIEFEGKNRHVGYYSSEIDAALAYNRRALELFGEFANLNTFDNLVIEGDNV